MNRKIFFSLVLNFLVLTVLPINSFAQNDYWAAVWQDFGNRQGVSQDIHQKIGNYELKSDIKSRDMAQYLTFLYAYMPQSDLADYDFKFFEQQVATGISSAKNADARAAENVFNLQGQPMKTASKRGVYIHNHHKYIVR